MFDKDLFLSLCDKYDVKFSDTANEPIICEHDKKLVQHIKINMPGSRSKAYIAMVKQVLKQIKQCKNHWRSYTSMRISRI